MNILDHSKKHQKYFEEISRIPRASFKEEKCADYVEAFAKERGLRYLRDEMHNIIIYKPAAPGYEEHGSVILQGHMDMVCEKNNDCVHDFDSEPLELYIEDGYLKARGTTLGADNAVACAYMMALLDSDLPHPALECVFTVQEEVGLNGVFHLKPEYFTAKRYINMDFGGMTVGTCTTSAGGETIDLKKPVEFEDCDLPAYRLFVTGLAGGHSGGMINKELGNSLKVCIRILKEIAGCADIRLIRLHGGEKNNAIPRECEAVFASSVGEVVIRAAFDKMSNEIKNELAVQEPGLVTYLEPAVSAPAMSEETSADVIDMMYILPTGLRHSSVQIKDLPTASENMASVKCTKDTVHIQYSLRAEKMSYRDQMEKELLILAGMFGMTADVFSKYPAWEYNPDSALRTVLQKLYKERTGEELAILSTHGGLECGVFCDMIPGLDVVTVGPKTSGAHTPKEMMDLASYDETYEFLTAFLAVL